VSATLRIVGVQIEKHLKQIEKLLGPSYKLTLVCRNKDHGDADIIMSADEFPAAEAAIARHRELMDQCEHGIPIGQWCEPCNKAYKAAQIDPDNGNGQ
jgi:hypothetical protein